VGGKRRGFLSRDRLIREESIPREKHTYQKVQLEGNFKERTIPSLTSGSFRLKNRSNLYPAEKEKVESHQGGEGEGERKAAGGRKKVRKSKGLFQVTWAVLGPSQKKDCGKVGNGEQDGNTSKGRRRLELWDGNLFSPDNSSQVPSTSEKRDEV